MYYPSTYGIKNHFNITEWVDLLKKIRTFVVNPVCIEVGTYTLIELVIIVVLNLMYAEQATRSTSSRSRFFTCFRVGRRGL